MKYGFHSYAPLNMSLQDPTLDLCNIMYLYNIMDLMNWMALWMILGCENGPWKSSTYCTSINQQHHGDNYLSFSQGSWILTCNYRCIKKNKSQKGCCPLSRHTMDMIYGLLTILRPFFTQVKVKFIVTSFVTSICFEASLCSLCPGYVFKSFSSYCQ
jgi:hypothetical protein